MHLFTSTMHLSSIGCGSTMSACYLKCGGARGHLAAIAGLAHTNPFHCMMSSDTQLPSSYRTGQNCFEIHFAILFVSASLADLYPNRYRIFVHETLQIRCPHGHTFAGRAVRHVREINILSNNVEINISTIQTYFVSILKWGFSAVLRVTKREGRAANIPIYSRDTFRLGPTSPTRLEILFQGRDEPEA